jgi:hypothetical protein
MFRLAERLGMPVGRLGVEMESWEFSAWHAYDLREARLREEDEERRTRDAAAAEARDEAE